MQSRLENGKRPDLILTDRPDSSQLVDLHVYVLPKKTWKDRQNLTDNLAIQRAISVGFVRVPESLTIHDLRRYIIDTCSDDNEFPKDFLYLRSVGRCLTKVKISQEKELKVKHYRPPMTFASEIYLLEGNQEDLPSVSSHSWAQSAEGPRLAHPLLNHTPSLSAKVSPRDLLKVRQEQERLEQRQIELARQRQQLEDEQQRNKERQAATKIQNAFRNYRERQNLKQQEADALEIEHLENEARKLRERQAAVEYAEERQVQDVVRLSNRLEELRKKRLELESNRLLVVRRIQQLQTHIARRRQEEKDLWKKKYFIEKQQISESEEILTKNSTEINNQLEKAKIRLNNSTKLRQQVEYESRLLRQELHQISSNLNALERYRLPKLDRISSDNTLQY